jgi:hypothetical protein
MKIDVLGKIYIAFMSVYFIISGVNTLMDVDAKLARIGLAAINPDGKIAFILIYCSLMIGIGIAIALLYYFSKTWVYSALLASILIASFMIFRLVGAYIVGDISNTQLSFLGIELLEVTIGIMLLNLASKLTR